MASIAHLLLFLDLCYFANAQWSGDIGYERAGRNWELRGGARYEINRGKTSGHIGGQGSINSNGQGSWQVNAGVQKTFDKGRGSWGVEGFRNSNGGHGARVTFKFRGRRSIKQGDPMKTTCSECVTIQTITSPEKLQEYTSLHNIEFAMIARFKNFYFSANETKLYFKIKHVLESPPSEINITQAKVFNVFAETSSCALACLDGLAREDFMVTGAMFHGRLIVHDKLLLLHLVDTEKETGEEKEGEQEAGYDEEEEEKEEEGDSSDIDENKSKSKLTGQEEWNEGRDKNADTEISEREGKKLINEDKY